MNLNIFSDLRKPGLVPGEGLSPSTKFDSVLEKNKFYIMSNRMRSINMKKKKMCLHRSASFILKPLKFMHIMFHSRDTW